MQKPVITQAMIDAYDEYTHITLDRRRFIEKLTRLAGSGVAAAEGVQHAFNNDTSEARYDKEAADLAWSRTVALFKEKLV